MQRTDLIRLAAACIAVAGVTLIYSRWLLVNAATVSTTLLLIVLLVATASRLWVAVVSSILSVLSFNFFFLPPVGTFRIADPDNWLALLAFLAVSLVASNLSAVARARTLEAVSRRDELARLFDLSRDVLVMSDSREARTVLTRAIARRFDLSFVAVALPQPAEWDIFTGGSEELSLDVRELSSALVDAQRSIEFDAQARTYAGHRTIAVNGRQVRLVPLRVGTKPIGILAAAGRPIEPGTLDALAGVVAIAIEHARFLEERKAAELTRRSEELKAALLASLAHDLRTPLTAIKVAASNLKATWLKDEERAGQSDLILAETERLTRLFQNVLEMARIDAGAVTSDARWTHPSELLAAAREQVEHAVNRHRLDIVIGEDVPVRLDPRLTASALAHLIENAAQYSPPGSAIRIRTSLIGNELIIRVRDDGPGLTAIDLPRVFDRFYRGTASSGNGSGTGMGLSIARGLLAAEHARVWAENATGGGAEFTIAVPIEIKEPIAQSPTA
jgi:two-component system sensor histidine kinase KdpD